MHPTNIPRTKQLNLIGFDMLRIQQYIECFEEMARDKVFLSCVGPVRQVGFRPPASWTTFEEMAVVEQAVEHGGNRGAVAEQFSPVFHRAVGSQQRAGALLAAHDDLQQFFRRCGP